MASSEVKDLTDGVTANATDRIYAQRDPTGTPVDRYITPGYISTMLGSTYQPLDADLTTIAGLTATTNNIIQSVSSAWASRTPTQVTATLVDMVGDSGSGGTKGLVPAPAAGDAAASKFLKADGTWAAPTASISEPLTLTRLLTVTQGTANEGVIASTGYSLTGANAQNMIDLAGTWNTSGNPIALNIAITNTASGSTAKFLSFKSGSGGTTEKVWIDKNGLSTWITGSAGNDYRCIVGADVGTSSAIGTYWNNALSCAMASNYISLGSGSQIRWTTAAADAATDTIFYRVATAIIGVRGANTSTGGALSFIEQTPPSAPSANGVYLYSDDSGGKTRLMALFATGSAQQIAIEP